MKPSQNRPYQLCRDHLQCLLSPSEQYPSPHLAHPSLSMTFIFSLTTTASTCRCPCPSMSFNANKGANSHPVKLAFQFWLCFGVEKSRRRSYGGDYDIKMRREYCVLVGLLGIEMETDLWDHEDLLGCRRPQLERESGDDKRGGDGGGSKG
ncbi:hypothetical protein AHAS_Ahas19G0154600 [Arachis hypogaea]